MAKVKVARPGRVKAEPGKTMRQEAPKGRAKLPAKKKAPKQIPLVARKSAVELRMERFVAEYVIDYNGRRAAIAAGYTPERARQTASELLAMPEVQAQVQARQEEVKTALGITEEVVLNRLTSIATADPRELTELHRGCCRYCWGIDHLYQRTPKELREDVAKWTNDELARQKDGKPSVPFNEAGGVGYNPKKDPNPDCPECFGDGAERVVFKDTRDLSPAARLLFAGIEQTQHGLKVRMHSQPEALVNIGKHLGMFAKRVEHTGKGGNPLSMLLQEVSGNTFPVVHDTPDD